MSTNALAILIGVAVLAVLLLPTAMRSRKTKEPRKDSATDVVATIFALPSRLLSAAHTGDVRMHILWMVFGVVILTVVALLVAGRIG